MWVGGRQEEQFILPTKNNITLHQIYPSCTACEPAVGARISAGLGGNIWNMCEGRPWWSWGSSLWSSHGFLQNIFCEFWEYLQPPTPQQPVLSLLPMLYQDLWCMHALGLVWGEGRKGARDDRGIGRGVKGRGVSWLFVLHCSHPCDQSREETFRALLRERHVVFFVVVVVLF